MSDRLQLAFDEAAKLPTEEQERFAEFLIAELSDDALWQKQFEDSTDVLSDLAQEAREERLAGKTIPLEEFLG